MEVLDLTEANPLFALIAENEKFRAAAERGDLDAAKAFRDRALDLAAQVERLLTAGDIERVDEGDARYLILVAERNSERYELLARRG